MSKRHGLPVLRKQSTVRNIEHLQDPGVVSDLQGNGKDVAGSIQQDADAERRTIGLSNTGRIEYEPSTSSRCGNGGCSSRWWSHLCLRLGGGGLACGRLIRRRLSRGRRTVRRRRG